MNTIEKVCLIIYFIWNIFVAFLYGIDKYKAKHGKWRISEKELIIVAFMMGGLGALFGMNIFHHKTKHLKFKIIIPIALIINIVVVAVVVYMFSNF